MILSEQFKRKDKTFIIAELSANHGRDIEVAKRTIYAACNAGADAIKIQTYTADTLTIDSDRKYFKIDSGTIWDGRTLYDLYKEAYLPWEWHKELKECAEELGLIFFSTPFDITAVDFLEDLGVPIYKVASFEIMDIPLIEYIASKDKPVIISTGVAELSDIEEAIKAMKKMGNENVVLLKTTSSYPAKTEDANLETMRNMKDTFGVEVGVSDHTQDFIVPIVSVALGGTVIEKHFILDRSIGGPDATFSLLPEEFKQMVNSVRGTEKALGRVDYSIDEKKKNNRKLSRSLFFVQDMKKGDVITEENMRSIRPGDGLLPKYLPDIIGKKVRENIKRGTPANWNYIEL